MPPSLPHTGRQSYRQSASLGAVGVGEAPSGEGQGASRGSMIETTTITVTAIGLDGEEGRPGDGVGAARDVYYQLPPQPQHHQQSPSPNVHPFAGGGPSYQQYHGEPGGGVFHSFFLGLHDVSSSVCVGETSCLSSSSPFLSRSLV